MNAAANWIPSGNLYRALGLDAPHPEGLRTKAESLRSLATSQKKAGMRLALGIKADSFIRRGADGKFAGYNARSNPGFACLCYAVATHDKASRKTFFELLNSDFLWANQFLPLGLRAAPASNLAPATMPHTGWQLIHKLADSLGQVGTEYALRMFTKPVCLGELSSCERNAYFFRMFVEEVSCHVRARIDLALTKPEFAPFAHLAAPLAKGIDSAAILDPATPQTPALLDIREVLP